MSWSAYSGSDPLPPPPAGFERAQIGVGDTLQSLSDESGVSAQDIAAANGVPPSGRSVPTCAWEQDLAAMILATGGTRNALDDNDPNNCEPNLGFPAYVAGQLQNLPVGLRPSVSVATATPAGMSTGMKVALALLALAGIGAAAVAAKKKKSQG